jgi:hypothetical protein
LIYANGSEQIKDCGGLAFSRNHGEDRFVANTLTRPVLAIAGEIWVLMNALVPAEIK